ncbi:MAG: hypothetical protein JO263_09910 [Candidatus Eremiobacteraeota bacterium]|nr:hypothetical protein [Candidatus Eremiobacteraeota bacterium]
MERIAPRDERSNWYRFHMRQAFWFGAVWAAIAFAALAWPLGASFIVGSVGVTIVLYAVAIVADLALFVVWLVQAMRLSARASRGELFNVPWLERFTGSWSGKP